MTALPERLPQVTGWMQRRLDTPAFRTVAPLAAVGFLVLIVAVDAQVSLALREADPRLFAFFNAITTTGPSKWYLVPFALLLFACLAQRLLHPHRRTAAVHGWLVGYFFFAFWAIALSGILANLVKIALGRARPQLFDELGLYGFFPLGMEGNFQSFPSGHATTLFALALALALFWPRGRVVLLAAAAFLASSRIVINKHYVSDVIAGAGLAYLSTLWLRDFCARNSIAFRLDRNGLVRLQAPGKLLRWRLGRAFRPLIPARPRTRPAKAPGPPSPAGQAATLRRATRA